MRYTVEISGMESRERETLAGARATVRGFATRVGVFYQINETATGHAIESGTARVDRRGAYVVRF